MLRAYFAWKRGLPFSYEGDVEPRGHTRDIRYTADGNEVSARTDVLSYSTTGYEMLDVDARRRIVGQLSHPSRSRRALRAGYVFSRDQIAKSIRPGTMVYDPNGHVATIFRIEPEWAHRNISTPIPTIP